MTDTLDIKRYINQICIGYSANGNKSYTECYAELSGGSRVICYITSWTDERGYGHSSMPTLARPFVAQPNGNVVTPC